MGVHGLWKLLEAAGKPVPLESLENKVLAVDVSIWLHQMMKGFQDSRGAPVPNAHLLGLFHRVCKLLYYRIKPVFVFDGGVPLLKKQTIAARKKQKKQASQNASEAKERLLKNLVKRKAIRHILDGPSTSSEVQESALKDDMFDLPPIPNEGINTDSEEEPEDLHVIKENSSSDAESEPEIKASSQQFLGMKLDLHTLDVHSEEFLSLPPDVRHDILSELKETRKQNSWGRLHEMPEESGDFSKFQLDRLLKRRNVQVSLEQAEKEMGGKVMRMSELQDLMTAQGVNIMEDNPVLEKTSQRIASDASTRYVLYKDPASSDGSPQSSHTSIKAPDGIEDNSLYNDQVEFIAQMAENMLQQLTKNRQENNGEEKKSSTFQDDMTKGILDESSNEDNPASVSSDDKSTNHKILADSWSSDDDNDDEGASKAEQCHSQKEKHADTFSESIKDNFDKPSGNDKSSSILTDSVSHLSEPVSRTNTESNLVLPKRVPSKQTKVNPKVELKMPLEIIIRPTEKTDGDDLFADVFETGIKIEAIEPDITQAGTKMVDTRVKKKKPLEIHIHPDEKPDDDDDIFADVFDTGIKMEAIEPDITQAGTKMVETREKAKKPLEILLHSGEKPDDDIFANVCKPHAIGAHPVSITSTQTKVSDAEHLSTGKSERLGSVLEYKLMEKGQDQNEVVPNELAGVDDESSSGDDSLAAESSAAIPPLFTQPATTSELNEMEASLEAERIDLLKERGRQERLAASITDQMCVEAQELLQLFGVPYVVAPMEAEAQCAFLDAISLTEGSITDDSDIWLFGGKKVYKNFFNQKKHVLQFTSANISHYFKLSREQLVQLALLVGSDYTTGIQGIGPVTALEVVAAFQSKMEMDPVQCALKGLSQFKDWWNSGRPHRSNRMRLLDKKLKNVKFSEGFPSQTVVEAYLRPSVENSQETFSWGALDLPALREYARSKFGWNASKTDEILLPVAKRWNARTSQRSIDSYFNLQPHLVEGISKMSKRVQKAVTLMEAEDSDNIDDPDPKPPRDPKERAVGRKRHPSAKADETKAKRVRSEPKEPLSGIETEIERNDLNQSVQQITKCKRNCGKYADLPVRAPTVPRERSSTGVKRIGVKSAKPLDNCNILENFKAISQTTGPTENKKKTEITIIRASQKSDREMSSKSTPGSKRHAAKKSSTLEEFKQSGFEEMDSQPCTSADQSDFGECSSKHLLESSQNFDGVDTNANVSSDLAALSEMNWEDDPWDSEMPTERTRPKVYFGGIQRNKPRQRAASRPVISAQVGDTRGVRPGWITQERLESRTAWVNTAAHTKREESIPQREQDQRARDEAKLKAIELVKASEARQASRLLGRNTKRARAKARPKGKILPEHNLSESSSDD